MNRFAWLLVAACLMTACGGGGGDTSGSSGGGGNTTLPPSGIGSAGGTVNGPSGAKVVVPAGALSQNTNIAVAQSSTGAPALPSGLTAAGEIFALTPHGTQFTAPVTLTIPFDQAATNGATPLLYKTNAQGNWEPIAGATFNSGVATAQISSFSHAVVVVPPLTRNEPSRSWTFLKIPGDGSDEIVLDDQHDVVGGELDVLVDFGQSSSFTFQFSRLHESVPEDFTANGYVFGTNNGMTYGALAEAPDGRLGTPEPIGSATLFTQSQSYIKNADNARLTYKITNVTIVAEDFNPPLLTGPAPLVGNVIFDLIAGNPTQFYKVEGTASVFGANEHFFPDAQTSDDSQDMLWFPGSFTLHIEDVGFGFGPNPIESCLGTRATLELAEPIPISVDLSSIGVGEEFTVFSGIVTETLNRRGGGSNLDCQASYVGAYLRDPADIQGTTIEFEGLTPTNRPVPLEQLQPRPPEPEECTAATNPLAEAGVLQFEAANFVMDESPRAVQTIAVTRTGGATGKVSATFTTSDGTATSGDDYTATNKLVLFADGESGRRLVRVPVSRDIRPEGDETVQLALSQPGGCAALGPQTTASLTIRDDSAIIPVRTFTVGGSVSGLDGTGLTIEEVTSGVRVTPAADGDFVFDYRFPEGSPYNVRIASHPTNPIQTCLVNNATGIADANVTDVNVICNTTPPSGSLDSSFGSQGRVTAGLRGGADAIAIQGDGKIVALGDTRMARYNVDGSLDTTFGTAGEVTIALTGNLDDNTADVAIQTDGKIVVVGSGRLGGVNARHDFAIARFNADGTLDSTFGTSGKTFVDFVGQHDEATAVILQPDGRILAIGHAANAFGENDFAVVRLTTAGVLDTTFSSDGRANVNVLGDVDLAYAGALQADGALVIVGEVAADNSDSPDTGLVRFTADGALDTTFGGDGIVQIAYAPDTDEASDVAIQSDGKIVVVGPILVGSTLDFMIARLNADGTRDNSFGTAGLVTTPFGTLQDFARAVVIQPDGAIVAAGQASSANVTDFGLVRLRSDGTFDSSFGGGGSLIIDFFSSSDAARALALQPDGKIVAAGFARNGSTNGVGLARIQP
jgi:uncharacterized delta-60 repeat protein